MGRAAAQQHPAAWLPAGWTVVALSSMLVVVTAVNRMAPDPYMVRAGGEQALRAAPCAAAAPTRAGACGCSGKPRACVRCEQHDTAPEPGSGPLTRAPPASPLLLPSQDEPFHVPATQRYCAGDFATWDPKITTFPGLYVLGAAYAWAARLLMGWAGVTLVGCVWARALTGWAGACTRQLLAAGVGTLTAPSNQRAA